MEKEKGKSMNVGLNLFRILLTFGVVLDHFWWTATPQMYTGIDKVRFRKMVQPGDTVRIDVKPLRSCPPLYAVHAELRVGDALCTSGDLSFAITKQ